MQDGLAHRVQGHSRTRLALSVEQSAFCKLSQSPVYGGPRTAEFFSKICLTGDEFSRFPIPVLNTLSNNVVY
jgi:hypothetical protein